MPERQIADLVENDALGLAVHAIGRDFVIAARQPSGMAMADVPAGGDINRKDGVAKFQQSEKHAGVSVGARMGLHIGEAALEELACSLGCFPEATRRRPIGARRRDRLAELLGALALTLANDDLAALERAVPKGPAAGSRYAEGQMAHLDSERE